ncbi:P-loop containing nucleoside triphosphate hydrolase protein [Scleroderma citrinum]
MRPAWCLQRACRLFMESDPSKHSVAQGPALKRAYSQQATASALKQTSHGAKVTSMHPRAPTNVGDQRPLKVPKLVANQSPSTPPRLHPDMSGIVSPPFTILPSSTNSKDYPSPLPSNSSSKSGRRKGKGKAQDHSLLKSRKSRYETLPEFEGPMHDAVYIEAQHQANIGSRPEIKPALADNPKSPLTNFVLANLGSDYSLQFEFREYFDSNTNRSVVRCTIALQTEPPIVAIGDHTEKKAAERLCSLSALYQLYDNGLLDKPTSKAPTAPQSTPPEQIVLPDGSVVNYERARSFMDYYCRLYNFGKPDVEYQQQPSKRQNTVWETVMTVGGRRIGVGVGNNKKTALVQCYLDVTQYLQNCDSELWSKYVAAAKSGKDLGLAPKVHLQISSGLGDEIEDLCREMKRSALYKNRPALGSKLTGSDLPSSHASVVSKPKPSYPLYYSPHAARQRSELLKRRREAYLTNPQMERMRTTRAALPIFTKSKELLQHIQQNEVTICMAATGSGKTTQIPQIILDDYIDRGEGSRCNIICTQPRRLAALSVADRVAKERGEIVGNGSIGYSVRFESKLPEEHGSITFCTIGVLLRRMQSAITEGGIAAARLDEITHIVVDEVHERDVDTDLLLVVLRRLLEDRKARNLPLKIVLMSATIDPTLFREYFADENGNSAPVIDIPGRTFPVKKLYLEDFIEGMKRNPRLNWIFSDESVIRYLAREEGYALSQTTSVTSSPTLPLQYSSDDELDMPFPLVAATVCHVLQQSDSGHVLVFLPGWEDIVAVQRILQEGQMHLDFNDMSKYNIHLLHSTIPLADQQVIFEPPPEGVRRIILGTNIAETSVTIPDVVYVVDTAKIKEVRYNPDRHMSSLVSAWVGSSNLNQRAGRAGRHRPGEYYGLLSHIRATALNPHQTVEMKRIDLSNVVMHVKALNFPDIEVEEVLAETIEPPDADRVAAAMKALQMVGALDDRKNLTSLGRVLLQLPVEVQMGRLVLYGAFFRCLDQAVTLAAILTNRDPFVSPMHLKAEAAAAKAKWSPGEFRSDALTILNAYNVWHEIYSTGNYIQANRFSSENFLSKPTLLLIRKIRHHLIQSLYQAGVITVAEGGSFVRGHDPEVPPVLNVNAGSQPLLAALIAIASQPKYAVRTGDKTLRTQHDKVVFIHPSSVNHRKHIQPAAVQAFQGEKQLYAFAEKRQNLTTTGQTPQTYLINTTRLDPMTYLLFGASEIQVTERGLECDGWLPVVGNLDALDDIQRLKTLIESCMLRVYEGILMHRHQGERARRGATPAREEDETGDDRLSLHDDLTLSSREISDLDMITRDIVRILNRFSDERLSSQSRPTSRTATPMASPAFSSSRLHNIGSRSGYSTPFGVGSAYNSPPGTPSRFSRGYYP